MQATRQETAKSHAAWARDMIERAALIIETTDVGQQWSARDTLAKADDELRTARGTEKAYSRTAVEKALEEHLSSKLNGHDEARALDLMRSTPKLKEIVATLRAAAPEVAKEIEKEILLQEQVLQKLAASEITDDEIDRLIREVREEGQWTQKSS